MGHAFDVPYMGGSSNSELLAGIHADQGADSSAEDLASEGGGLEARLRATRVPKAMLADRPSDILRFREVAPFCVSANDLINPLPPSHFFGSGWNVHHPAKGAGHDDQHHWFADTGGSKMRVPVNLSAGDVAIYYIQ